MSKPAVMPRLKQPLFTATVEGYRKAENDAILYSFIRAYDAIWNLVYYPQDMPTEDILNNGEINLQALGNAIEQAFGDEMFEPPKQEDDGQLSFNFDEEAK
jgi:hypothetical protein